MLIQNRDGGLYPRAPKAPAALSLSTFSRFKGAFIMTRKLYCYLFASATAFISCIQSVVQSDTAKSACWQ